MNIGLMIMDYGWPRGPDRLNEDLRRFARMADTLGFHSISVPDHLWQVPDLGGPSAPMLECYSTLAYIAALTTRVRLVPMVSAATFRQSALLAKIVTTVDVLSSGRAWLGIGAGWYIEEAVALGPPCPGLTQRLDIMEEAIRICLRVWSGDGVVHSGPNFRLERPLMMPKSRTSPHPPILIGGSGERKTLRLVARYADACNLDPSPELPRRLDILRAHCETEQRDFETIEKTVLLPTIGLSLTRRSAKSLVEDMRQLRQIGVDTVIIGIQDVSDRLPLRILGREVIPAVAGL